MCTKLISYLKVLRSFAIFAFLTVNSIFSNVFDYWLFIYLFVCLLCLFFCFLIYLELGREQSVYWYLCLLHKASHCLKVFLDFIKCWRERMGWHFEWWCFRREWDDCIFCMIHQFSVDQCSLCFFWFWTAFKPSCKGKCYHWGYQDARWEGNQNKKQSYPTDHKRAQQYIDTRKRWW